MGNGVDQETNGDGVHAGRWLRVMSRGALADLVGHAVERTVRSRLPEIARERLLDLRWASTREFFVLSRRARRVRGLSKKEFMHELEASQHALLLEQRRARAEIEDLEARAAGMRSALEQHSGELGEEEDLALDGALEKELRALLGERAAESEAEIAAVIERSRQLRNLALERCFAEYRERVDVLERRLVKLKESLAHSEAALEKLAVAAEVDHGVPSIYRTVQGIAAEAALRAAKLEMLRTIFESNYEFQKPKLPPA